MEVGDLIDSEIMQIIPVSFAKNMVDSLLNSGSTGVVEEPAPVQPPPRDSYIQQPAPQPAPPQRTEYPTSHGYSQEHMDYGQPYHEPQRNRPPVNVQPVQFEAFDEGRGAADRGNIGLIMDVPLQITVELGRTNKLIREVLEFGPGSIIELDKLAGEPVDILVNGKAIAKGEVVVIDESFAVRITDIVHPSKRL